MFIWGCDTLWLSCESVGFMIERSRVQVPASPLASASVTKQYNLVPATERGFSAAGKVTVGLASHWPCVTDSVVYPPTNSMAYVRERSTLPKPHWGTAPPLTFKPATTKKPKDGTNSATTKTITPDDVRWQTLPPQKNRSSWTNRSWMTLLAQTHGDCTAHAVLKVRVALRSATKMSCFLILCR